MHCTFSAGQCEMYLKAEAIGQGRVQCLQHSTYTGGRCTSQCTTTECVSEALLPPLLYMAACMLYSFSPVVLPTGVLPTFLIIYLPRELFQLNIASKVQGP